MTSSLSLMLFLLVARSWCSYIICYVNAWHCAGTPEWVHTLNYQKWCQFIGRKGSGNEADISISLQLILLGVLWRSRLDQYQLHNAKASVEQRGTPAHSTLSIMMHNVWVFITDTCHFATRHLHVPFPASIMCVYQLQLICILLSLASIQPLSNKNFIRKGETNKSTGIIHELLRWWTMMANALMIKVPRLMLLT